MTASEHAVATALGQALAARIGEPRYNLWFRRTTKFRWDETVLVVGVPNHFYLDWLQKTFGEAVKSAAAEVLGRPLSVRFVIDPELFQAIRSEQEKHLTPAAQSLLPLQARQTASAPTRLGSLDDEEQPPASAALLPQRSRRWHRLEEFVTGPCNQVAYAAAVHVVENPGQGVDPLVLHGPVGTGKTHLLEGIYTGLRQRYPHWRICYITAEEFTNRFVQAMRLGKLSGFRRHFRAADAVLLDDLQFLAGKRATREEFLHTLDALLAEGRQVVLTCDCHPRLTEELTPELQDRLLGGAVWGLSLPDSDTRLAILRAKAARSEAAVPEVVLRFLAGQLRGNVRELEGALVSLQHYSRVTARPISVDLAREALGELLRHAVRVVRLGDVEAAVCQVLRLEARALQTRGRAWAVSHPRMLAMFLARKHTTATHAEIGQYFGGRNHSTVVAAEKKLRRALERDECWALGERTIRLRDLLERIERELFRA